MATRAIAATGEKIVNNETYVSSALAATVQAYLPAINDGSAGTVAVDTAIRVETTGAGAVILVDSTGHSVGVVPARSQAVVVARSGAAQSEADSWVFRVQPQTPAAFQTISASPTQAEVTAIRDCLVKAGFMKAE